MNNGLKKIYLFKSADYQFAEIDLSDNTLLLGESGVGKTTLMRAILFFYTMDSDSSVLNINTESKKSFSQWYFKEINAHIVYEYKRDDSTFLFIVSSGGKLHYTFVDMTNSDLSVKDLLLEGREPRTLEKLNECIEKNILPKYQTTQKDRYIRAFHKYEIDINSKKRKIKQESKVDFTLFEDISSRKEFAKTLSNIFATSKVSSDSVKKTIVSLIDDTVTSIDLKGIREDLSDFVVFRQQIRRFENQIPKIEELSDVIRKYKENKQHFKESANKINLLKTQSDIELIDIGHKIDKLDDQKKELNSEYQPKIDKLKDDVKAKDNFIFSEDKSLSELKKKRDEYQSKNIDNLIAEYRNKKSYENSLEQYKSRYKALTSNADEVKDEYKNIFEKLEKDKDGAIFSIKDESRVEKEKLSAKKEDAREEESQSLEEETKGLINQNKELDDDFFLQNEAFEKIKIAQAKVENYPYNNENIERFNSEIVKFKGEISNINLQINNLNNDIKTDEEKLEATSVKLKVDKDKYSDGINRNRKKLFEEQGELEKKLDFDKNNLYGYINKNALDNKNRLLTFIKDDILFAQRDFSVEKVNESGSIFGLNIEFDNEDFGVVYDVESLLDQLKLKKIKLKKHNEDLIEGNYRLEEIATKETAKLNKSRTELSKDRNEKTSLMKRYESSLVSSENALSEAKKVAHDMRKEDRKKYNVQYLEQKDIIDKLESQRQKIQDKIKDITSEIKNKTKSIITKLNNEFVILDKDDTEAINTINQKYKKDLEDNQSELNVILEKKGVDKKVLKELNTETEKYESKLKAIEDNLGYVHGYLQNFEESIKGILYREDSLENNRGLLIELNKKLEEKSNELKLKVEFIKSKIDTLEEDKESLNTFLKKYEKEISNQPIEKVIKNILSIEYSEDVKPLFNDKEFLPTVIYKLTLLHSKLGNNEDTIITRTQRATRGLDKNNIFKLAIVDDDLEASENLDFYLSVAYGLIEYVEKDKIGIIKESSSEKFKSHLNAISKDIELYESSILDVEEKVNLLGKSVKKAVMSFNVIDEIKIRMNDADNYILEKLKSVRDYYNQNSEKLLIGLFNTKENKEKNTKTQNELASKIEDLVSLLASSKEFLHLQEGFVLDFRVTENGNKLAPAQTLNDIGSNGTSTLVKTIINISLLQMVNKNSETVNHCILDEIGTISPTYFRELKAYANSSGFLFVNGMPTEDDILISMYPTVYIGQKRGKDSRMLLATMSVV